MCSTETDAQETTPLLNSECSSRYVKNSQLESGPSCSASPIYRRSFSADTLSLDTAVGKRTSSLSPDRYSQQNQPPSSRSEPFCNVRKRVELRLENSGSVARDHLASERTFLAYMRTSLATTSAGVGKPLVFIHHTETDYSIFLRSTYTALFCHFNACLLAQTQRLRSSVGCFHSHRRPLGPIHRFVGVNSMQSD